MSHVFVMEWAAIWKDLVGGLLIAGGIAAWVPDSFWPHFFLSGHPLLAQIWGSLVGPLVAVVSFVCFGLALLLVLGQHLEHRLARVPVGLPCRRADFAVQSRDDPCPHSGMFCC